jgi:putative restriction endonuclease
MNLWLGVTDQRWYEFLTRRPDLDEVNFWQPGGRQLFRALSPGEPFLFKLKYPTNAIAGGGFFAHSSILPIRLAWEAFEEKNGAASLGEMFELIAPLKSKGERVTVGDPIGCIILRGPFFLPRDQWIPSPESFAKAIVTGRRYDIASGDGALVWRQIQDRLGAVDVANVSEPLGPTYGGFSTVRPRAGQGEWRIGIMDLYSRRCAVTGERALPVLEAAHIKPVSLGGQHERRNGLLLRSDVHRLFDDGYVTITPDYAFKVSDALKEKFDDGETYRPFHASRIWTPDDDEARPSRELLEWHNAEVFQA